MLALHLALGQVRRPSREGGGGSEEGASGAVVRWGWREAVGDVLMVEAEEEDDGGDVLEVAGGADEDRAGRIQDRGCRKMWAHLGLSDAVLVGGGVVEDDGDVVELT